MSLQLDWYLEAGHPPVDWNKRGEEWLEFAKAMSALRPADSFRRSLALLCQYISECYYPHSQSDQRRIQIRRGTHTDAWLLFRSDRDWEKFARAWNPQQAADLFALTPEILKHAYEALAVEQEAIDPLSAWHQLVQFVPPEQRKRLKGDALLAETIRSGAHMLRMLHRDLYEEELPVPNEVTGHIITHVPELGIRADTRRFLEFVTNRYHLNPQALVALFVEGPTEKRAIEL